MLFIKMVRLRGAKLTSYQLEHTHTRAISPSPRLDNATRSEEDGPLAATSEAIWLLPTQGHRAASREGTSSDK